MSQSFVIEVDEESAGLVVADGERRGFVFHAASSRFGALDGRSFASVRAAEKAAVALRRPRQGSGEARFATPARPRGGPG